MGCRGRDRTVVGFITTYANNVIHHKRYEFESRSGEEYSIQHYVIKIEHTTRVTVVLFVCLFHGD
jgi:hypothetical protein